MKPVLGLPAAFLILSACTVETGGPAASRVESGGDVPESVVALAAPYQDIRTARVLPEDGCYWYQHAGPVETTLLPLRTVDGRPICTQASIEQAPAS
ncbi:hypothetical protein ACW9UR_15020 [Halovulum sp. GXIMD14794]